MTLLSARDLMTSRLMTVRPTMGLNELVDFLRDNKIHGAMVKEGERIIGVASFTDVLDYLSDEAGGEAASYESFQTLAQAPSTDLQNRLDSATVNDVMTPAVLTCDATASAGEVADLMLREGIHRVVVTEGGTALGVLSATDLLRSVKKYEERLTGGAPG